MSSRPVHTPPTSIMQNYSSTYPRLDFARETSTLPPQNYCSHYHTCETNISQLDQYAKGHIEGIEADISEIKQNVRSLSIGLRHIEEIKDRTSINMAIIYTFLVVLPFVAIFAVLGILYYLSPALTEKLVSGILLFLKIIGVSSLVGLFIVVFSIFKIHCRLKVLEKHRIEESST